jgi:hypothetical protein
MPDSSLLRSITGGICDAALAPHAWSDVLRQLTEYLGAVGAAYILTNKRTGQVDLVRILASVPVVSTASVRAE